MPDGAAFEVLERAAPAKVRDGKVGDVVDDEVGDVGLGVGKEVKDGLLEVGREEVPAEVGAVVGIEG